MTTASNDARSFSSDQGYRPFDLENWQLDDDLRQAERTLATNARSRGNSGSKPMPHVHFAPDRLDGSRLGETVDSWTSPSQRIDTPPAVAANFGVEPNNSEYSTAGSSTAQSPATESSSDVRDDRHRRGGLLAWSVLLVGIMAFVCGGLLLAWSFFAGQQHLWDMGLPATLAGQAALLIGLMLQVERIWHNSRCASERLRQVDRQLTDLRQTTTRLGNSHGAASNTFYSHMAEGANPHLLLADLKGQLDLLAVKISRGD